MKLDINLPEEVENVMERFRENGYEVNMVGGALRDFLLSRPLSDYDLNTNARPEDVKKLFYDHKLIDIGSKYGTIIVVKNSYNIEVTSYRRDGSYLDARHPGSVDFTYSLEEDMKRRDFTINALAWSRERGLVDYFSGLDDLNNSIIKSVGKAKDRIEEDALRMLRAIRFACKLNFNLDKDLYQAIIENKNLINKISKERISQEFNKILTSKRPAYGIDLLHKTGLLGTLSEDLDIMYGFNQDSPHHDLDLMGHTLSLLELVAPKLELRLAALFHDVGKIYTKTFDESGKARYFGHQKVSCDIATIFLKDYKYSNRQIELVVKLIDKHMYASNPYTEKSVKRLYAKMGEDIYDLFDLQRADIMSTVHRNDLSNIDRAESFLEDIKSKNQPVKKSQLKINGKDLISLGYKEGRTLGKSLEILTDMVIENNKLNDREILLKEAERLLYTEGKWKNYLEQMV